MLLFYFLNSLTIVATNLKKLEIFRREEKGSVKERKGGGGRSQQKEKGKEKKKAVSEGKVQEGELRLRVRW